MAGASAPRRNDLTVRIVSAAILIPIVLLAVWLGGMVFVLLIFTAAFFMTVEWAGLTDLPVNSLTLLGLAVSGAILAIAIAPDGMRIQPGILAVGLLGAAVISALAPVFAARRAWLVGGIVYIGLALVAVIWMRSDLEDGLRVLVFLLICVWATDIGGYIFGRTLGGPKLAPKISPGKTWSGFIGAILASAGCAALFSLVANAGAPMTLMATGAGLAVVAQMGDLGESAIKRHFGVKDSGELIPGHGGILDRVDGMITASLGLAAAILIAGKDVFQW